MSAAYKPRCNVAECIQPIFRAGYCVDHYRQHGVAAGKAGAGASEAKSEHLEQFRNLCQESTSDQMSLFLKSFIFDLEENWKDVVNLEAQFRKRVADSNEGKDDLNPVMAADFLQKHGHERTAVQRKEEIADIDLDKNDRISFIEYLLLHYKVMILKAYYKRVGQDCPYDLSRGGVGVAGVGAQLLDELFTMPMGLDPALEKAIEEFTATKKAREAKVKALSEKAAEGGVKGLAASNEIKQLESQDLTEMNRLEITLNAAKKRAARDSGEVALKKKKDAEEAEKKAKQDAGRNKLKDMAARWNTPQ